MLREELYLEREAHRKSNCEEGGYNKIFDERGLSDLICMSIMGPVSAVLPSSFITSGGRVTQHVGYIPDWGAGHDGAADVYGKARALVIGDTKFNWSLTNAFNVILKNRLYEDSPLIDTVRPIEQVQHYGAVYGCRYVYIISNRELVVMRLHLAPFPVRTSPRPQRTRPPPSHQRVISSSTISKQLTDMSIDESSFKASIGLVEYKKIPWSATSGLTIKLALYCLVRLAAEDGNDLKPDYPPLASKVGLLSTAPPSSQPRNPIPTASTVTSTPQASNETEAQFYDTVIGMSSPSFNSQPECDVRKVATLEFCIYQHVAYIINTTWTDLRELLKDFPQFNFRTLLYKFESRRLLPLRVWVRF
ncbi:hypothetical protein N7447_004654 [Penicillium robsamsonii]|uniref:uncharacterized protein n=1 Tax=Penicillium robsamsonii TaxID=1792511 RepID=UPI002547E89F|nr:uncharacterized protein N7447_004654 [Penicillium robsamsonii]KAJ5827891.1 hypothetical protein N7447_004654 [Penicillium robsamsonii]